MADRVLKKIEREGGRYKLLFQEGAQTISTFTYTEDEFTKMVRLFKQAALLDKTGETMTMKNPDGFFRLSKLDQEYIDDRIELAVTDLRTAKTLCYCGDTRQNLEKKLQAQAFDMIELKEEIKALKAQAQKKKGFWAWLRRLLGID